MGNADFKRDWVLSGDPVWNPSGRNCGLDWLLSGLLIVSPDSWLSVHPVPETADCETFSGVDVSVGPDTELRARHLCKRTGQAGDRPYSLQNQSGQCARGAENLQYQVSASFGPWSGIPGFSLF